jgi:hypothetical protein
LEKCAEKAFKNAGFCDIFELKRGPGRETALPFSKRNKNEGKTSAHSPRLREKRTE